MEVTIGNSITGVGSVHTHVQGLQAEMSEMQLMAQVLSKHRSMMSILGSRQASLQIVASFWQGGDVRGALNAVLQSAGDALPAVLPKHFSFPLQASKLADCNDVMKT